MTATYIHPSSIVEDGAVIGEGCHIGPLCTIGADVTLGANVRLHSHVAIAGYTEVGEGTQIFPFASLGHAPQDLKFKGEKTRLVVGKNNVIREHVTMNPGTEGGGSLTQVGDNCLFMVGTHIAHDCIVGSHVIMANNATLAGHVHVGNGAVIGGLAAVHQFVRIGEGAMIGGLSGVENDVIPFGSVIGERGWLAGLNLVGLKRRQLDRESIHAVRHTFKDIFGKTEGTVSTRAAAARETHGHIPAVDSLLAFIETKSHRALLMPRDVLAIDSKDGE